MTLARMIRFTGALAASIVALAETSCVSRELPGDLAGDIASATGNPELVVLEVEGEPVDAAGPAAESLTLASAIRASMAHSPEIQTSLARVRAAQADLLQSRLLPNPILRVVLRFPESGGSAEIEAELAADLVDLLRRPARISAAESRLRVAAAAALTAALDLVAEVEQRYAAVQAFGEQLRILDERMAIVARLLQLAQDRLEFGEGTRLEVLTFETRRTELEAEITDLELDEQEERISLARLIGQPSGDTRWRLEPWAAKEKTSIPEARWLEIALEKRPEIRTRLYELEALGADVSLAQLAPFVDTLLGADAEKSGGNWSAGPSIATPVPLFDFGQARRERARAAVIEARHALTGAVRQVIEEVRRSYAAVGAAQANRDRVLRALIPAAQLRYEQAEAQFRAGQTDVTALLIAEEELYAARNRLVQVERRNSIALVRLHRAVGGPGFAPAPQVALPAAGGSALGGAGEREALR